MTCLKYDSPNGDKMTSINHGTLFLTGDRYFYADHSRNGTLVKMN